jgi:cyclic nucleotide gated channel
VVSINDQDIEKQVSKTDGDDSGQTRRTKKIIIDPEGRLLLWWNIMFAVSCVIAVSMDPLFFYLPIINAEKKCVGEDEKLKIVANTLRSVTDFIYLLNIILQFICPYIDEASRKLGRTEVVTDRRQIAKRYFFSRYFAIDILAILPLPQVSTGLYIKTKTNAKLYTHLLLSHSAYVNLFVFFLIKIK